MDVYLPIAAMSVSSLTLLVLGLAAGFLSGMFGVGGGFLLTPLLTFIGIPPAIAVGTQSNQLVGTSLTGAMLQWHKRQIDIQLGVVLLGGSLVGTFLGVALFSWLKKIGHVDLVISLGYIILLGSIGMLMLVESSRRLHPRASVASVPSEITDEPTILWGGNSLLAITFKASNIRVGLPLPLAIGLFSGVLVAMLGIGGSFVLVPAMIYLLRVPPSLVNGTSMFQMLFVTAFATFLQASLNQNVDIVLAGILLTGSIIGVRMGTKLAGRTKPELARFLLALLILGITIRLLIGLVLMPDQMFSIQTVLL